MNTALLVSHGFFGDNFFISSVAKKLIEEQQFEYVDFMTGFPQVFELLQQNPYIRNVYMTDVIGPELKHIITEYDLNGYDKVFTYQPFSFSVPPALEAQIMSGILKPTPDFQVWTTNENDEKALEFLNGLRSKYPNKKIVAWMRNWRQKAYKFTEKQYWNAVDNYFTGYGTENRDINFIVNELEKNFVMVPVGVPENLSQMHTAQYQHEYRSLSEDASILKFCDYFVGTEGGLANLAAGVGCKTILTYEFMWQCYGPRGTVRPFKDGPQLGPVYYFPEGHVYLPLYKTDEEIVDLIKQNAS
jgi:hypothetical protein